VLTVLAGAAFFAGDVALGFAELDLGDEGLAVADLEGCAPFFAAAASEVADVLFEVAGFEVRAERFGAGSSTCDSVLSDPSWLEDARVSGTFGHLRARLSRRRIDLDLVSRARGAVGRRRRMKGVPGSSRPAHRCIDEPMRRVAGKQDARQTVGGAFPQRLSDGGGRGNCGYRDRNSNLRLRKILKFHVFWYPFRPPFPRRCSRPNAHYNPIKG
jgi:hypothetical protein